MKNITVMKRVFLTSILIGSLVSVTACGSNISEGEKQEEIQVTESVSETSQVTTENPDINDAESGSSDLEDSITDETNYALDGCYASAMTGTEKGVISMEVVGDELHIRGTFAYDDADLDKASDKYYDEYYFGDKTDAGEYVFLLSADTQFIASGGEAGSTYDRQQFVESYCSQPDLGLGLSITVENGVVTEIVTAS